MELRVVNPGFDDMIDKIMGFQTEDASAFWSEPLYYFYPQLDKVLIKSLPGETRKAYIAKILRAVYEEQEDTINQKVSLYAARWEECKAQISGALSDAFKINCGELFNEMTLNVSMNPIEPRFLETSSFDIFYLNSERGAIGRAIHEIIHFAWFYVWNQVFGDSNEEYEAPSLKWILSEMVVEPIMTDPRLSSLNPYFERENGGCVYPYFFDMKVEGKYILDTLNQLYRSLSITEFMKKSYAYCLTHEDEIREHIQKSEQ